MNLGTLALWQINKINEFVRRQSLFNVVHAPDFFDRSRLRRSRREAVIEGSIQISLQLHSDGIRDARDAWFRPFEQSVEHDWQALQTREGFWNRVGRYVTDTAIIGDLGFAVALVAVIIAYANTLRTHSHESEVGVEPRSGGWNRPMLACGLVLQIECSDDGSAGARRRFTPKQSRRERCCIARRRAV